MADKPVLSYFNPRHAPGRAYLSKIAVDLALLAIPGFVIIFPGILLGIAALTMGAIASRYIKESDEPLAYREAHAAILLGFLELIVGFAMVMAIFH